MIDGNPCSAAELQLTIFSEQGAELYRYDAPLNRHVVYEWDDPNFPRAAEEFAASAFEMVRFSDSYDLPASSDLNIELDGVVSSTPLPLDIYESIRAAGLPTFTHQTAVEAWRTVVFDGDIGKGIVVLESGM